MEKQILLSNLIMIKGFARDSSMLSRLESDCSFDPTKGGRAMHREHDGQAGYFIGKKAYPTFKWTPSVLECKDRVENLIQIPNYFNICISNYYPNGRSAFRFHTDYNTTLEKPMVIASISFGATREFQLLRFRPKESKGERLTLSLEDGDLLLMGPGFQSEWMHSLVPDKSKDTKARVNLTFRRAIVDPKGNPLDQPDLKDQMDAQWKSMMQSPSAT